MGLRVGNTARRGRYREVTEARDSQTTTGSHSWRVTNTIELPLRPLLATLALLLSACRHGETSGAASERPKSFASLPACAATELRPVAAAPAAGLWSSDPNTTGARVVALLGPVAVEAEHPRLTRRVETLEQRDGAAPIRLASDTASVRLELLPAFGPRRATAVPTASVTEPAAIYAITPLVLLASYEPCDASAGEPRIRYLRRDRRGGVAADLMLHRATDGTGTLP